MELSFYPNTLVSCLVVSVLTVWENFILTLSLQSIVIQSTQEEWKWKSLSHVFVTPWTVACQAPLSMEFSRPDYGVDSHSLLLGIFPTHGLNPCLPHGMWILYPLRHEGSPKRNEVSLIHQPKIRPNICIWIFLNQAQKIGIFKGCIIRFTQLG